MPQQGRDRPQRVTVGSVLLGAQPVASSAECIDHQPAASSPRRRSAYFRARGGYAGSRQLALGRRRLLVKAKRTAHSRLLAEDLAYFPSELGRCIRLLQLRAGAHPLSGHRRLGIARGEKDLGVWFAASAASTNSSPFRPPGITTTVKIIAISG